MSKIYFLTLLVVGIVTGTVAAYSVGELGLDPRIDRLEDNLELASLDLMTELDRVSSLQNALDIEKSTSLQQVERSEEQISKLEGFLSSQDRRIESLDRNLEVLQDRKELLEIEEDDLQERIIAIEAERSILIGEISFLRNQNGIMNERVDLLVDNISSLQASLNDLESKLSDRQTSLIATQSELVITQAQVDELIEERNILRNERAALEGRVISLESRVQILEDFIDTLNMQTLELISQIDSLRTPDLDINLDSIFLENAGGTDTYEVSGAIANFGSENVEDVQVTLRWIDGGETVHTEMLFLGDLDGRSISRFVDVFSFEGAVDFVSWEAHWT
jgi:septal ring factor EnvC (AmiA/AmiB activator)